MSLKGKLQRMKKHMVLEEAEHKIEENGTSDIRSDIPFLKEWEAYGVKPFFFEDEYCLIREVEYPLSHRHGHYCFSELDEVIALWNKSDLSHTLSAKGYENNSLFFFDTETTGLGGEPAIRFFCSAMQGYIKIEWRSNSIFCRNRGMKSPCIRAF